jgi:hypothetical protein
MKNMFAVTTVRRILFLPMLFTLTAACLAEAAPGDLDPAFGANGRAIVNLGRARHSPTAVAAQADGKYLISFETVDSLAGPFGGIARFNADHTRDNTWGYQGITGSSEKFTVSDVKPDGLGGKVSGLAVSSGQVLAIESGGLGNGGSGPSGQYVLTRVSRYTPTGQLDRTFGSYGQTIPFPAGGGDYWQAYNAIAIAPDGKIVVAGEASGALIVARYFANGALTRPTLLLCSLMVGLL